jgi:hypothetical protein
LNFENPFKKVVFPDIHRDRLTFRKIFESLGRDLITRASR